MKRAVKNLTRITAFGEEQPKIENRLELAAEKDEFGMPLGRIIHSYDDNDAALWNANFEEGVKIARATDAKEVWAGRARRADHPPDGRHHHGHWGAANSVVNSFGQTHEIPNLYVAGPGIFATAGASNPTYTIFALSLRGAEIWRRIGDPWRGRFSARIFDGPIIWSVIPGLHEVANPEPIAPVCVHGFRVCHFVAPRNDGRESTTQAILRKPIRESHSTDFPHSGENNRETHIFSHSGRSSIPVCVAIAMCCGSIR